MIYIMRGNGDKCEPVSPKQPEGPGHPIHFHLDEKGYVRAFVGSEKECKA